MTDSKQQKGKPYAEDNQPDHSSSEGWAIAVLVTIVIVIGAGLYGLSRLQIARKTELLRSLAIARAPLPSDLSLLSPQLLPIVIEAAQRCENIPSDPEPFAQLGRIYHANREAQLAIQSYEIALKLGADDAHTPYLLGLLHMDMGESKQAIIRFQESIARENTYAPAHNNLGLNLLEVAREDKALQEIGLAIALDPDDPNFHTSLAKALRLEDRFEEAATSLRSALKLDPNLASAHQLLGLTLQALGENDAAQQHLNQITRYSTEIIKDPWLAELQEFVVSLQIILDQAEAHLAVGRPDSAVKALMKARTNFPDEPSLYKVLGKAYQQQGQSQQAVDSYVKSLALEANNADTRAQLAAILFDHNNLIEADREAQKAIDIEPLHAQAHIIKGALALRNNRYVEAIDILKAVIARRGDLVAAYVLLGQANEALGQLQGAVEGYEQALKMEQNLEVVHRRLGIVYRKLKRFEEAKRELEIAAKLDPSISETLEQLRLLEAERKKAGDS